jgi:outer membrane protein OmpA-like peptidoglycan-associated protein
MKMKKQIIIGLSLITFTWVLAQEPEQYLHFNAGGGIHNFSYNLLNGSTQSKPGYTFNAAYSYFFSPNIGFQTGLGAQNFKGQSTVNFLSTTPATDELGRAYDFRANYKNWEENQQAVFLDIPLVLQFRHKIGSNLGIIASAGAKVSIPVYSKFKSNTNGEIVTTGYYSEWNTELSDLPQYGFSTIKNSYEGNIALKTGCAAIADLGFLLKLSDKTDFYIGGYFNYGLNNMLTPGTKEIYQRDGVYNGVFASSQVKNVIPVAFGVKVGLYLQMGKRDADGDGVSDRKDKCPNTPSEAFGLIDINGCPLDTDGDGVPDYLDKCSATPKEAIGKVDINGCPLDTDGDGVPDYLDKCPDTPKQAIGYVDQHGCILDSDGDGVPNYLDKCPGTPKEAVGSVDKDGCPTDSDGDGIPDYLDKCSATPKEAIGKVDINGCPLDTDGDGVPDYLDKCPAVAGDASSNGCPEVKKEVKALLKKALQGIQFESAKSIIKPVSYNILNQIAVMLVANPTYMVEIQGHTDNVGRPENNLLLSDKRAEAVKDFLINAGVEAGRLSSKGFGDTVPVSSNATAQGKELNRRVEFIVTFETIVKK